jgi:Tfp pilus assembly protein PilW
MTLVELLIAMGISGMVFVAVGMMIFSSGRSYAALANYVDLDNRSRKALDQMTKDIRQVDGVTAIGTTTLAR